MVAWGLTIAIAGYPAYCRLQKLLGGRGGWAAVLFTVVLLAVLVVPIVMLSQTLVDGSRLSQPAFIMGPSPFRRHRRTSQPGPSSANL